MIDGIEAQLLTARANLDDATLRAPFDGVVASRSVDNFANVQANETIAVLQELGTIDLNFDVPGPDVPQLASAKGLVTIATLDALPDAEFTAELVEFSTEADPATQTYRGRVSIPRPGDVAILPGMVGTVAVSQPDTEAGAIAVPPTAIAAEPNGDPFVWVVAPPANVVEKRRIETGDASGASVVVLNGLNPGDMVVTAGISQLQPGMEIRPVSEIED